MGGASGTGGPDSCVRCYESRAYVCPTVVSPEILLLRGYVSGRSEREVFRALDLSREDTEPGMGSLQGETDQQGALWEPGSRDVGLGGLHSVDYFRGQCVAHEVAMVEVEMWKTH